MKRMLSISLCFIACISFAQNTAFDKFKQKQEERFNQFKSDKQAEYDAFRKRLNDEYADFMRKSWESFSARPAEKPQEEKPVSPVVYQEPAPQPSPQPSPQPAPSPAPKPTPTPQPEPQPVQIPVKKDVVVVPKPEPAPEPIAPVQPKEDIPVKRVSISYYGTLLTIPFPQNHTLKLPTLNENTIADAWQELSKPVYDLTLKTALDLRKANRLCDWAYMDMLRAVTEKQYGKTNEAVLMQAFLMSQSGYRIRLAMAEDKLHILVASQYNIFHMNFFTIDNMKFYIVDDSHVKQLYICKAKFDKEKSLSLQMSVLPSFGIEPTPKRTLTSKKGLTATVSLNKNLIDFFNIYPTASINNDIGTRWAAYANTPLEQSVKDELYPPLRKAISGMSEKEAVNLLLNWVQTAFVYEYDDKVWGYDRAFFAQETLYYPYSDCEDRSILFSRLVRDLLGLEVVLLYYPGHLATAVGFTAQETGDYLTYQNKRYVVCDPTYIGAPVGRTMPGMNNQQAKIIVLD